MLKHFYSHTCSQGSSSSSSSSRVKCHTHYNIVGVFAFLIWIFGLLVVVFWMVSDDLVVGTCFFGSWWLFF